MTDERRAGSRRYRRTALGLAVLGIAAGVGAAFVTDPSLRNVLVAFAGVGLFGGVLLYWIRPAATADVDPPERVYDALAATGDALVGDLDLSDRRVYVPTDDAAEPGFAPVYLVVPDRAVDGVAAGAGRRPVFAGTPAATTGESPGDGGSTGDGEAMADSESSADGEATAGGDVSISLYPTGAALFAEYEAMLDATLATDPVELGDQLATGVATGLELADAVDPSVDPAEGSATLTVRGPRFGDLGGFDHPVASFVGVGFAMGLAVPVTVDVEPSGEARTFRLVCEWAVDEETADGAEVGDAGD